MTARFPVPGAYRELARSPRRDAWCDELPGRAEALAQRWGLTPDGAPRYGFLSVVWPVRDGSGRPLALKVHDDTEGTEYERPALLAAQGRGMVALVEADPALNALLLQRLDPARTLGTVGVDEACAVVGDLAAAIASHRPPNGMRSLADIADEVDASIADGSESTPGVLPGSVVARARETMRSVAAQCRSRPDELRLTHGDLHFENVLHTLPEDVPRWLAIDPLPCAGLPEWEVAPVMRNRWDEAVATGDPERALRRKFDIVCDHADLDRDLALRMLQAIATDNLLWLTRDRAALNPIQRTFVAPYTLVARW